MTTVVPLRTTTGFLFDTNCVVQPPCHCVTSSIFCRNENLQQIPTFSQHSEYTHLLIVALDYNNLTSIPANAFFNLSLINTTDIQFSFKHNQIFQIDIDAFRGIENSVSQLNMNYNRLATLPLALKKLSTLDLLYLENNPLISLDVSVMSSIGKSVTSAFSISVDHFPTFPTELSYLHKVSMLAITKIPFTSLDEDVFTGLNESVRELMLFHTNLTNIPSAICSLTNLQTFRMEGSTNLYKTQAKHSDTCFHGSNSIYSISMINNDLTVFPDQVKNISRLTRLDLSHNALETINLDDVQANLSLIELNLSYNRFRAVPVAVNKLANLRDLSLSYNRISALEDFDFNLLKNLGRIDLSNNKLLSISRASFQHNPLLRVIDLSNTDIDTVPEAVLSLQHLHQLFLYGNPMNCSCSSMMGLSSWNLLNVISFSTYIDIARCNTGQMLHSYLVNELQKCP